VCFWNVAPLVNVSSVTQPITGSLRGKGLGVLLETNPSIPHHNPFKTETLAVVVGGYLTKT
jgi:hypothetical protein